MGYTYAKDQTVTIGEATKKSEIDQAFENTDWLYTVLKAAEEELAFDGDEADYYVEATFTGSVLTGIDIYTDSGKGTQLWDIDLTYTGDDLTGLVVVRSDDSTTRTYTITYSGGNLATITVVIS